MKVRWLRINNTWKSQQITYSKFSCFFSISQSKYLSYGMCPLRPLFRLNKLPFLNRQDKPSDFPGFSKTGFRVGNKGRAIVKLGTEDMFIDCLKQNPQSHIFALLGRQFPNIRTFVQCRNHNIFPSFRVVFALKAKTIFKT
jgi:hypothetical protein